VERGSASELALHGDVASEQLRQLPGEGEAEPGPLEPPLQGVLDLPELAEDPLLVLGSDADPGVRHREHHAASSSATGGRHADLAPLRELERVGDEVAEDLRDLGLVRIHLRQRVFVLEDEAHRVRDQEGPQHPSQRAEEVLDLERDRTHDRLARLDLGQVQEVVHELRQVLGRLAHEPDLLLLLGREVAVRAVLRSFEIARIEFRGVRNSWLMLERKRDFISSARRRCSAFSSSSGVEGDHAAVRVLELAIEADQVLLPPAQVLEDVEELLVLLLHLGQRVLQPSGPARPRAVRCPASAARARPRAAASGW
jgi:hypothetical protein